MKKTKLHSNLRVAPWTALLLAGVLMMGCRTAGNVAGKSEHTRGYLVVNNPIFFDQVSIVDVGHDVVGELMRGHATLKSNKGRTLEIRYRFQWYDASGVEVDAGAKPYITAIIEGKDALSVSSMAPNPNAREFKIRVAKVSHTYR